MTKVHIKLEYIVFILISSLTVSISGQSCQDIELFNTCPDIQCDNFLGTNPAECTSDLANYNNADSCYIYSQDDKVNLVCYYWQCKSCEHQFQTQYIKDQIDCFRNSCCGKETEDICSNKEQQSISLSSIPFEETNYLLSFSDILITCIKTIKVENLVKFHIEGYNSQLYTYEISQISQTEYKIEFSFKEDFFDKTLLLNYQTDYCIDKFGQDIAKKSIEIKMTGFIAPTTVDKVIVKIIFVIQVTAVIALVMIFIYKLLKKQALKILFKSSDTVQLITYQIYLNVHLPFMVQEFLQYFKIVLFLNGPYNFNSLIEYDLDDKKQQIAPLGFSKHGITTYCLYNLDPVLSTLSTYFLQLIALNILIRILECCCKKCKKLIQKIKTIHQGETWNPLIILLDIIYLNVITFTALQFHTLEFSNLKTTTSIILSILFFSIFAYYPFQLNKIIQNSDKGTNKDKFEAQFGKSTKLFKNKKSTKFLMVISYRKFFFALSLVFLQDYPIIQLSINALLNVVYLFLLIRTKPFRIRKIQRLKTLVQILFLIASLLLITLPLLKESRSFLFYKWIGWIITFIYTIILLIELVLIYVDTDDNEKFLRKIHAVKKQKVKQNSKRSLNQKSNNQSNKIINTRQNKQENSIKNSNKQQKNKGKKVIKARQSKYDIWNQVEDFENIEKKEGWEKLEKFEEMEAKQLRQSKRMKINKK